MFKPAYFRSAVVRLWLFDGRAVVAREASWVFCHCHGPVIRGVATPEVTRAVRFETHEEAEAYRALYGRADGRGRA